MKIPIKLTSTFQKINWKAVINFLIYKIKWKQGIGLSVYWIMRTILSVILYIIIAILSLLIIGWLLYLIHDPTVDFSGFD